MKEEAPGDSPGASDWSVSVGADGFEPDQIQLGDRPVPVRLHILDTMRAVEAALVQCADDIAAAAQRDPKRWRHTGRRTASRSVLWLLARIERAPGPYRRITGQEEQRIVTVAAGAAERIERALGIAS